MKKSSKIGITVFVLVIALGIGGFFGVKYFFPLEQSEEKPESFEEKQISSKEDEIQTLAFLERVKDLDNEKQKIIFLNIEDKSVFEVTLPKGTNLVVLPQVSSDKVFYLTTQISLDDVEPTNTIYSQEIISGEAKKIAVTTLSSYPRRFWLSPDKKSLVVERIEKNEYDDVSEDENLEEEENQEPKEEVQPEIAVSLSVIDLESGSEDELLDFDKEIYLEDLAGFVSGGDNFYYLQKDESKSEIKAINIKNQEVKKAFPLINYSALKFEESKDKFNQAYSVSPDERSLLYPEFNKEDEKSSTDLYLIKTRNGAKEELLGKKGLMKDFAWSENSEKFSYTFVDQSLGIPEIWISDLQGFDERKVVRATDKGKYFSGSLFLPDEKGLVYVENLNSRSVRVNRLAGEMYSEENLYLRDLKVEGESISITLLELVELEKDLVWKTPGMKSTLKDSSSEPIKTDSLAREEIMTYLDENLKKSIRREPYIGEEWKIIRFGFPKNGQSHVYVTYDDNHEMGRTLLQCEKLEPEMYCNIIGNFNIDGAKWNLNMGEDQFVDQEIQYLEKDFESGKFEHSYKNTEVTYFPYSLDRIRELQQKVDQGEEKFRVNPLEVVKADLPEEVGVGAEVQYSIEERDNDLGVAVVKFEKDGQSFLVTLEQFVRKEETGVFTLVSLKKIS